MAHERIQDVREETIDQVILVAEHTTHVDVLVLQESVCTHIPPLHDAMKYSMPPIEVDVEIDG